MKQIITLIFLFLVSILAAQVNPNYHRVRGYYRKDGTYVKPHYRTNPNSTNRDNYSTRGNINPHTGKRGWITPDNKPGPSSPRTYSTYDYTPSRRTTSSRLAYSSNSYSSYPNYFSAGKQTIHYTNGQETFNVSSYKVTNFKPDRIYHSYDPFSGEIKEAKGRSEGYLLDGMYHFYDTNGMLRKAENYKNGLKNGFSYSYDENGKQLHQENYINGLFLGVEYTTSDGYQISWNARPESVGATKKAFKGNILVEQIKYKKGGVLECAFFDENSGKLISEFVVKGDELNGPYKRYYDDGRTVKEVGQFLNDQKSGPTKEYHKNGKLSFEGYAKNGELQGPFKSYNENGRLLAEGHMQNGQVNGEVKTYTEAGELEGLEYFRNGSRNGKAIYYSEGKPAIKGRFLNDQVNGLWEYFYTDNEERYFRYQYYNYDNGILHGPFQEASGDSITVGSYYQGKLHGELKVYHSWGTILTGEPVEKPNPNAIIAKGRYEFGKKQGYWQFFRFTSKIEEGNFVDDQKNGTWKYYYYSIVGNYSGVEDTITKPGQFYMSEQYLNGKLHGKTERTSFLVKNPIPCPPESEQDSCFKTVLLNFREVAHYNQGEPHGSYLLTNEEGDIIKKGSFRYGKKVGPWIEMQNNEHWDINYENGVPSGGFRAYYPDGNLKMTGVFNHGLPTGIWYTYYPSGGNKLQIKQLYSSDIYTEVYYRIDQTASFELQYLEDDLTRMKVFDENGSTVRRDYQFKDKSTKTLHLTLTSFGQDTTAIESYYLAATDKKFLESPFFIAGQFGDEPRIKRSEEMQIERHGDFVYKSTQTDRSFLEGAYNQGEPTGTWQYYQNNQGTIRTVEYRQGRIVKEAFSDRYTGGSVSGKINLDYPNGIMERAKVKKGLRHGKTLIFDEYGKLIETRNYKNGILIQ